MEARKQASDVARRIIERCGVYMTPRLTHLLVLAYRLGRLHGSRRKR